MKIINPYIIQPFWCDNDCDPWNSGTPPCGCYGHCPCPPCGDKHNICGDVKMPCDCRCPGARR